VTAPKLTKAQRVALKRVAASGFNSIHKRTGKALAHAGLIEGAAHTNWGPQGDNNAVWIWWLTDAGRAALKDGAK
jgi:hypothetical protein